MFGSSVPSGSSGRNFSFDPTRPNPFTQYKQPSPATARQSTFPSSANTTRIPNDPLARNLFADEHPQSDQDHDPFSSPIDLSDQLSLLRPLDAVKFCLKHVRIDQLDPELFIRMKQRTFTVPQVVEQLIKDDQYFKSLLQQLYVALGSETGLDMRAAISDFKSDAVVPQTCADELADLMLLYCIYRAGSLPDLEVPKSVHGQLQEVVEIVFRTPRCDLFRLVEQCRDGNARYGFSHLLTGASLDDSPGQFFLMDADIRPRFVHILDTCVSLYLTSNTALLVDIALLMSRLLFGQDQSHSLKQSATCKDLERIELWLARRRPIAADLMSACVMLGKIQDFPGDNALIDDALKCAFHPVFSDTLRAVIKLNAVPRNRLTWKDFESLAATAQLQHDADPEAVTVALALHAVHSQNSRPAALVLQPRPQQLSPIQAPSVNSDSRSVIPFQQKREERQPLVPISGVNLSELPAPPPVFPTTNQECAAVAIQCRDCDAKFEFSVSEQEFYIKTIKTEDGPHFPVRCNPCRVKKRIRFEEAAANLAVAAPDPVAAPDDWDEYSFCNL